MTHIAHINGIEIILCSAYDETKFAPNLDENGVELPAFKTFSDYIVLDFVPDNTIYTDYDFDFVNKTCTKKPQAEIDARKVLQDVNIAKAKKLKQINDDFEIAEALPVDYLGNTYFGGIDSVRSIDEYVRLNRLAGITTHKIWDINGADTNLSDAEVDGLLLTIGQQSSINKFNKKNRKVALDLATTVIEVEAV